MWCKSCCRETLSDVCEICGDATVEEIPSEVYWCPHCKVPLIKHQNSADKNECPLCHQETAYLCADVRPVFPQERLLIEIMLGKPLAYLEASVWAADNRYYIDGKPITISFGAYHKKTPDELRNLLEKYALQNDSLSFEQHIQRFIEANTPRLNYIRDEAFEFIKTTAKSYPNECIVLSFSGGKDSTVTADLTVRALSDPSLVHIFGNTTLEFPLTIDYVKRFRNSNPKAILKIAINREQNFYDVCKDIGPPARMLRWCCSMFKTGPITRVLNSLYPNRSILTFYGIRKCESVSRGKYNRVEDNAESVKIQKQKVASPIFFWRDIDIWLYILGEDIDFNDAYCLGYDRVGCWCCPNNNARAQFLSRIYMPEESKKWRDFLISFARRIGKPDAEEYVDSGKWKARQGGNGVAAAEDIKIRFTDCTTEDHAKVYELTKPMDDSLIGMFVPFGRIAPELGRKLINEIIVVDIKTNVPILSIQPFVQGGYVHSVKVKTMNVAKHEDLQRMVGYQIRKFNACRKCLKCESLCPAGAISVTGNAYIINPDKCKRCKMCMTAKYLDGGCMMVKYLKTKV